MVDLRIKFKTIFLLIAFMLILTNALVVFGQNELVHDEALLFTDSEGNELEERVNALSDEFDMDIVITTTNDAQGKSSREYADDYFDDGGFGRGPKHDGVLFLIDMDNREAYLSTTGESIKYLTDERIDMILDHVYDAGLPDGDYYGTALGFIDKTQEFLLAGIPSDQHTVEEQEPNRLTGTEVLMALILGAGAGGIFFTKAKSGYKLRDPGEQYSYRSNSTVNLRTNEDQLVDTIVTRRRIPRPKPSSGSSSSRKRSSSGRSTTHRSSSGRSHGGKGRKF